jgi:uncharacterized protein YdhG (YjbR/CyaY superfamily)
MAVPASVDAYLKTLSDDDRVALESMRTTIKDAAPEAVESIAYSMPAFRSHGRQFLVSYAAYQRHYSLFPASEGVVEGLGDEIAPFLAGHGTIRFPKGRPLPLDTIRRVVEIRLSENAARLGGTGADPSAGDASGVPSRP